MARYICDVCGTGFDEPIRRTYREMIDGHIRKDEESLCPICGNGHYSYADECPCGAPIHHGDRLCSRCRSGLLERFTTFADSLRFEEAEQIDEWMDGDTIQNRRNWR